MFSSRRLHLLLFSLALLPACSAKMQTRMDAVWERLDPMGHRKGHQVHYYPRANNPGMVLPEDEEQEKRMQKMQKESRYVVPMPGYGRGAGSARPSGEAAAAHALPRSSGSRRPAVSPDGYALPGSSMPVPRE